MNTKYITCATKQSKIPSMSIMRFNQINFKRKYLSVRPHQSPLNFTWKIGVLEYLILTIRILKIRVLMIKFEKKILKF